MHVCLCAHPVFTRGVEYFSCVLMVKRQTGQGDVLDLMHGRSHMVKGRVFFKVAERGQKGACFRPEGGNPCQKRALQRKKNKVVRGCS